MLRNPAIPEHKLHAPWLCGNRLEASLAFPENRLALTASVSFFVQLNRDDRNTNNHKLDSQSESNTNNYKLESQSDNDHGKDRS